MKIIEKIDSMIGEVQAKLDDLNQFKTDAQLELNAEYTRGWDEAMVQAGKANSGDKLYSEAELNAELALKDAAVRAELQPQIDSLAAQVQGLQGQIDSIPAQIEQAKQQFKEQLKQAYEAQQVAESQGETGFGDLLK